MAAYYNEHDPKAAEWLRELIKAGAISDGEVDERSIEDVLSADLNGFTRCHFFAGIGVWDYALNQSGFTGSVWTGSCPCQPFSAAGKGEGFADERHLWPAWFHLIEVCRPDCIFGEQVSSADGTTWLDLVHSDLEGIGYRIGTLDIPSASVGAPHRRQRLYFVADAESGRDKRNNRTARNSRQEIRIQRRTNTTNGCEPIQLAITDGGNASTEWKLGSGEQRQQPKDSSTLPLGKDASRIGRRGRSDGNSTGSERSLQVEGFSSSSRVDNAPDSRCNDTREHGGRQSLQRARFEQSSADGVALGDTHESRPQGRSLRLGKESGEISTGMRGATNGFWSDAEWIYCRDGKYRPTKPGIFPLANGIAGRVGLLRGYGNAINGEQAKAFIECYLDLIAEQNG